MGQTWQALFTKEHMSIGRGDENDLVIPDSSVSRRHATVDRRGDEFIIRDAGSDNGLWVGKEQVEAHKLEPGDIVSLGRAKLVFKGGFNPDDLTLISTPVIDGRRARRPVVFVPGMGGSELWLGSEQIYPVPKVLISNPEILSLPGDPRIEPRRIVSDVVIVPGILKQQQYSRLGDYLESGLGYTRGKDLLEFAYDWRRDIRLAAKRLAETIDQWRPGAPITIIAHSLGTLVTRYYVEKYGGKRLVERIVLMGGPQYGTPKALMVILVGPGILPFGLGDERLRQAMAHFPTSYQILPTYPSVFDQNGDQIDVMRDDTWLPEGQRPYLKLARDFRQELGHRSSVPCVSIFGYGFKTAVRANIERRPDGRWREVSLVEEIAGDLSVPAGSAVLKNSEIHPVYQEHGALYVDNDVKMRLKVELTRSTTSDGKR
jgi:pimeloyl-ACP methyl ester carboxylesterase